MTGQIDTSRFNYPPTVYPLVFALSVRGFDVLNADDEFITVSAPYSCVEEVLQATQEAVLGYLRSNAN